jgi:hypothetical protein
MIHDDAVSGRIQISVCMADLPHQIHIAMQYIAL